MDGCTACSRSFFFYLLLAVLLPARAAAPDTHPGALWLVENHGAIVIKTLTGSVGPEISDLSEMDATGTDYSTGNAWFYGNSQLVSVSPSSEIIAAFPLPALPDGNADALLFDDQGSQVWIAIGKTLARVSSEGVVLGQQTLDANIAALAFDRVREHVWVAMPRKIVVLDAESNPLFEIGYQQPGRIWDIHYDRGLDRVWVTSHAGLQWYTPDGTLGGAFASPVSPFADHVSADGEGRVWIAGTHDIAALTADGSLLFQFRVFSPATGFQAGGRSRGLFADPSSDSAWTINGRWAVQVSADGDVVQAVEMVVDGAPRNIHAGALHYDITPPVIEIIKPAPETFTNDNTPGILVAYDDFGSAVDTETFEFTLDGRPLSVNCEANAQDAVCIPVEPIQDGEVTIAVTVEDFAFNRSAAGSTIFTVDTAPPELVEIVPTDDLLTNKPRQTLVGRFNEPVTLKINDADVLLIFSEAFEHHIELAEGENAIHFVATDRAGNVGEASITYMLDTVPPVITVTSPEDNLHTRDESVTVAGSVNEPALVSIDDEIAGLEGLEFSGQPQLIEGLNPIGIEAVDLATNASHETVHVTLDTTPPQPPGAITVVETEDGIEIIGGPGAVDPYAQVQILPSNALLLDEDLRGLGALRAFIRIIQSGYADANGAFSIMIDNADIPPGGLRIRVVDLAGNNSDSMPLPEPEPDRRNHPVGRLPGELSVDATGAANYRIPLELPKGAAGMQPDLALLYSSRAGNGHLGVGWSLSGLSAVTRCPKTIAQDGVSLGVQFDDTDRFCLDGQRLIKKGSSWSNAIEYRTEIESFQKVTSEAWSISTIPDHFEVRDKSGLIRQYGTTQDSRVNVQGSVVPMLWAISRIRDRFGNYIAYTYEESSDANGSGEFYPKEIAWYNNQDQLIGRVKLEYADRPDKAAGFIPGGGKTALTKRLEEIKVYAGAELARYYKLQYEQAPASGLSTLISAQLCASENQCFPETRFGWKHPGAYSAHLSGINIDDEFMAADIDGDGLPDWVYWDDGQFIIKFGDHSKGYRATNIPVLQDGGFCDFAFDPGDFGQYLQCVDKYKLAIQFALVGDYDGDGFDDVLVPQAANEHYWLLKSTGENLQLVDSEAIHNDIDKYRHLEDSSNIALDINGDGKAEALIKKFQTLYIERYEDGAFGSSTDTDLAIHFSHRLVPLQANGDGIPDLHVSGEDSIGGVLLGTGENFEIPWNRGPRTDNPVMIDANGDGLTDILRKQAEQWALHVNTGDGWQATAWRGGNWQDREMRALDWNRDGKQDLMVAEAKGNWDGPYGTVWTVHLSDGDGFSARQNSGFNDGAHGGRHFSARFMDLTGDGIEDLFYDDGENRWSMLRPSGLGQSLLTGVVDGYSMETAVGYLPLSLLGDDYLGSSDAGLEPEDRDRWNIRDFQGPVPVVRFFAQDTGRVLHNGNHVKVVTSYRYKGGKIDIHGRGFLGFAEVHASNANTGIDTMNHHKQSFPFTGMVHKAEQWRPEATPPEDIDNDALRDRFFPGCPSVDPFSISAIDCDLEPFKVASGIGFAETTADGELISRTTNALEAREIGNSHFVWAASTDSRDYDLDSGSLVRRIRTAYEYDDHGNATVVDVRTDDGSGGDLHRVRTVNTYDDNTTIWLLGRLASATVTHSAPGTASITRRAEFLYHSGRGQLTREVLEPSDPQLELVTEYAHDGFGNLQTRIVSSGAIGEYAIQSRTTVTNYDSRGVYPESTRNHLGHIESYTWNAKFNAKTTSAGPDGLLSWSYNSFGQLTGAVTPRSALHSTTSRNWCGGGTACHHENAETQVRTTSSTGGERIVELDRIGREVFAYERGLDSEYIATETWYDMLGRPYLVSNPYRFDDPVVCYVFREYDNLNRVIKEYRPASANECDRRSDLDVALLYDHTTPPPRYTAVTTYNYNGLKTIVTHPVADGVVAGQPRVVEHTENVAGRLLKVVEWPDSATAQTTYAYTATGETSRVMPPSGQAITLNYDKRGRKTSMQDPDMGHWQYRHNALGELVWQQDAKGQVVTLNYDVLGRMIQRTESEGITSWTYDTAPGKGIGKLASVEQHDGYREAYAYTAFGEVDTQLKIIDGLAYFTRTTYDAFGRVNNVLYPAARDIPATDAVINTPDTAGALQLAHHYGESGKLKRVQRADGDHDTVYWQAEKINAQGQLERATLGNGLANNARFDAATGMVLELGVGSAGNTNYTRQFQSYAWDSAGNLLSRTDQLTGVHETFQYDRLYRLTGAVLHAGDLDISQSFEYDAAGNLKRKGNLRNYQYGEGATGQTRPHAAIGIDRFSGDEKTETLAYLYDANGNVEDANGRMVTWSSFNKPVRIEKGNAYSSFAYGPGRARYRHIKHYENGDAETTHYAGLVERIEKTRGISTSVEYRQHIIAGGNVVAIVTDYITSGVENTRYLHRDHLGSVTLITDNAGKIVEQHQFDAWGQAVKPGALTPDPWRITPLLDVTTTRGFTGHEMLDHLGLVHMNGRIYDPEIGRFLSADPFVQFPASTQGYNRYSYLNNNPLNATDPSGFFNLKKELGNFFDNTIGRIHNEIKNVTRWMFAQMSPQMAAAVVTIGSFFCGPAAPACAAAGTYEYQRAHGVSSSDARKAALAAAIATYATQQAGAYADAGQYGKAVGAAYTGGYTASRINGGDGVRGGTMAVVQLGLKVAMDAYSGYDSTLDPPAEGATVKSANAGVRSADVSNTGAEITIPSTDPRAPEFVGQPLADLSQEQLAYLSGFNSGKVLLQSNGQYAYAWHTEGSAFMNGLSRNGPGANSFSVFHDQWMFNWGNIQNPFILAVTIPPAAYLQYCALGVCGQYDRLKGR